MPLRDEVWRSSWREELLRRLRKEGWCGELRFDEPMFRHTTFRIGGPAAVYAIPESRRDLMAVLTVVPPEKWFLVGAGSNLLVADAGISGVVIRLGHGLALIQRQKDLLWCGGAAMLAQVSRQAAGWGLSGLEFAVGIPGTLGGAVYMNAGAHGSQVSAVVTRATVYFPGEGFRDMPAAELAFGYRSSALQGKKSILVEAALQLQPAPLEEIRRRMEANLAERRAKQPLQYPSAGSFFKNPPGDSAGRLIEAAGCKGLQVGGAMVAQEHANFLVNTGRATARDVLALCRLVQERVKERFGVWLEPEVQLLGDFTPEEVPQEHGRQ